jgi:PAS domain S-box-containing protein|nr:PAS domain S-box protein [Geothrix sp.]
MRTLLSLAGASLLVALLVVPSFWAFREIKAATRARSQAHQAVVHAEKLLTTLGEVDTDVRRGLPAGAGASSELQKAVREDLRGRLGVLRGLTRAPAALAHLEAALASVEAPWAEPSQAAARGGDHRRGRTGAVAGSGPGTRWTDALRSEARAYLQLEEGEVATHDAELQSGLAALFVLLVLVSLFMILAVLALVVAVHRQTQQRIKGLVHLETRHLLQKQVDANNRLQQVNATLQESEEKLVVTLNSIGDAVIATDAEARVRVLNPVAEQLTGWTMAEAVGHLVDEVFHIINQETRQPSVAPVLETLAHGTVQGLANHTLLIARDGGECAIADSCAPIRDRDGRVVGAVLVFRDVSEEYAVQRSLHDSAALIQTILNAVVDGIITLKARGGIIETVNPAAERMFGYAASELIGQTISVLIPELDRDQPSGSLEYFSASHEARAVGLGREVLGRRKDGQLFPLEIAVSEMQLGGQRYFTGILRDISTRKQAEEALLKAGALQNAIFNSANFSSIATDAKGVIQIFNVGAERMLGFSATEVMNKITPADISDPKEVIARAEALSLELGTPISPGFEALVFKASRGIEDIYELSYIRKDGSRFPALVSVTALRDAQDAIIGYLLIGTDNTARQRVEAERALLDQVLQDKNAELMSAKIVADKANLAKSEFLSSMSHELRSPLNAILGFAQLMDSETPPATPRQKASIDQILHAGWYLLELINEILDLAVIESGKLSLSEEPVSLAEVMLDCQAMIEPQGAKRGLQMTFPQFEAPAFVQADRIRLKQVLINILSNAIKYNRPDGTVTVVCTTTTPGRTRISVRDTGLGLPPDKLRQLFQPFNRLGQEQGGEEGTGIGLVMSKLLVELMGGSIGVESRVGEGSLFWCELDSVAAPRLEEGKTGPGTVVRAPIHPEAPLRTLLYVEDNPANLSLVEQIIARRPDLRMVSAGNGTLGIELARKDQPVVILMDINLPGISGIQALKILQEDRETRHIPVVAISANAMLGDIAKGLEAGFFRYLTKPINVTEFMATIDEALDHASTRPRHS